MKVYQLVFLLGVVCFQVRPPLVVGDCFELPNAGANRGPYTATHIFLATGSTNYPWEVVVTPSPPDTIAFATSTLNVGCKGEIFRDGFELGNTSRWNTPKDPPLAGLLFKDDFESGDLSQWQ